MSEPFPDAVAHELLPWFVCGTLEQGEAEAFAAHLADCTACREELPFLETVRAQLSLHGEAFLAEHPEAERLVDFARGDLDEVTATAIRNHVELCSTCKLETRWITGEAVAADEPISEMKGDSRRTRFRVWPAAVAAAILLLAIPFLLRTEVGGPTTRVLRPHAVWGLERSEGLRNLVQPRDEATSIPLLFEIDLPASAFPVQVDLVTARGSTAFSLQGIRSEDLLEGYLLVDCARSDCVPGAYELRVSAAGATAPSLVFGFEVLAP